MLTCMKAFTGFGAFIILLLGLGMLGLTIWGYFHSEIFLTNTSMRNTILGVMLGADLFIIGGSIQGLYGICKKKGTMICIFQIIVIIFMVIFAGVGIGAVYLPDTVFKGDCSSNSNEVVLLVKELYQNSSSLLCKSACPCNLTDASKSSYNDTNKPFISIELPWTNGTNIATQLCPGITINDTTVALFDVLGNIENAFSCSLWCSDDSHNLIYRFSNVNDGKPESFCYPKMQSEINTYSKIIYLAAFGTAGVLFLMFVCNIIICCHPKRRGLGMRQRFVYQNEMGDYQRV